MVKEIPPLEKHVDIIYGGLKVDQNMIASKKKVGNIYIIDFKNGQSIRYPQQAIDSAKLVNQECHSSHGERPQMLLFNVNGATITGRDGFDDIRLYQNCHNNTVVLDNDNDQNEDNVHIETIFTTGDDLKKHPSTSNKFQLGDNDTLTFYDLRRGQDYRLYGPDIIDQNKLDAEF